MRAHQRQVAGEGQDQHGVHARSLQQLQFHRQRRQQLGRNVGTQNAQRMRLEGHHHRLAADGVGALRHAAHHLLMRAMHAVEVAHAHHGGTESARHFLEFAEYLHGRLVVLELKLQLQPIVGQAHIRRAAPHSSPHAAGRGRYE